MVIIHCGSSFRNQSLTILSALVYYIYGLSQPVMHCDIKPENIPVKHRDPDCNPNYLHVKLSDFGLSKTGSFKSFCGTPLYLAPEVQSDVVPRKYLEAVDIWALGFIILRVAYDLPYPVPGLRFSGVKGLWRKRTVGIRKA